MIIPSIAEELMRLRWTQADLHGSDYFRVSFFLIPEG